jgi:hypothetical protein
VTINALTRNLAIVPSADGILHSDYPAGDFPVGPQPRNLYYEASFDGGTIAPAGSLVSGAYIFALKDAGYVDGNSDASTSGGGGTTLDSDLRVTASETVGGEVITPRRGGYFVRGALHYDKNNPAYKDYNILNNGTVGDIGGSLDKPRLALGYANAAYIMQYDIEYWFGFSIRIPLNFSHDDPSLSEKSIMLTNVLNAGASRTCFALGIVGRQLGVSSNWQLKTYTNATSTQEDGAGTVAEAITIGPCDDDVGRWTDWVIRVRSNPFTVPTNANTVPNGKNQVYPGMAGILQVWKSTGPGRVMTLTGVNRVNVPVGLVPHATATMETSVRMYKYGWKKVPTKAETPVWLGFDEIRWGAAVANGTGYSDVDVDQRAMP